MRSFALSLAGAAAIAFLAAAPAQAEDKFTYMTNWYAQAEHGGFYQAVARASTRSTAWT
jgi:NitT/TauT family transport system substrate-binding protein